MSQLLTGISPAAPSSLSGLALLNQQHLAKVHPSLAERANSMIQTLASNGISILITQSLRTWKEQDALYAKGRTTAPLGEKFRVTNARGGQSYHNFGLAVDIVVLDAIGKSDWDTSHPGWAAAAQIGKSVGLEWGGNWKKFKDLPHFQFTGGLGLPTCRALFAKGGLPAIWNKI